MSATQVPQILISEYGLTKSEALFAAKLIEGKSVETAGHDNSMNSREAHTTLNRILFKMESLRPRQTRDVQAAASAKLPQGASDARRVEARFPCTHPL